MWRTLPKRPPVVKLFPTMRTTRDRKQLIEKGVFHLPVATKQGSISFAHTSADIEQTLDISKTVLEGLQ